MPWPPVKMQATCAKCGTPFVCVRRTKPFKYCSERCWHEVERRINKVSSLKRRQRERLAKFGVEAAQQLPRGMEMADGT